MENLLFFYYDAVICLSVGGCHVLSISRMAGLNSFADFANLV